MKITAAVATTLALLLATPGQAHFSQNSLSTLPSLVTGKPSVSAEISLSQQRMLLTVVDESGFAKTFMWNVSTGRDGYRTPTGSWNPTWLSVNHWSKKYDAPMPYAVFFKGGYAIHATDAVSGLGRPASHGCIRLAPQNAAMFFELVKSYGKTNTNIVITR